MDENEHEHEYGQSRQLSASVSSPYAVLDLFCVVCTKDGKNVHAEGFCVDCSDDLCRKCLKSHKNNWATRNHRLQNRTVTPKEARLGPEKAPYSKAAMDDCTQACEHHPKEVIKFYCKNHGSVGCSVCMTFWHRHCERVEYISDIASNVLTSKQYKTFEKELKTLKTMSQNITKNSEADISKTKKCYSETSKSLQMLRNDMNKAFDELESDIKNQAEKLTNADIQSMKAISDTGKDIFSEVENITSDIQMLRKNDQLCQLFIIVTRTKKKLKSLHDILQKVVEGKTYVQTYIFEPSGKAQQIINFPVSLGNITKKASAAITGNVNEARKVFTKARVAVKSDRKPSIPSALETVVAVHMKDIPVRTITDGSSCYMTGCAFLHGNRLVLTDCRNSKVKLVNLQTATVTSELITLKDPWDLTPINADKVAITVPSDKTILFVSVADELRIDKVMAVGGKCKGIAYSNNKLFVTYGMPAKIEIMTLKGSVERKIERDFKGVQLFKWPLHLALSPDCQTIYVSDRGDNRIKGITFDGDVVAVFKGMKRLGGLAVNQFGSVIISRENDGDIHLLHPDSVQVRPLIRSLNRPRSLCYSHNTGHLYVGQDSNIVKVYRLS